MNKHSPLWQCSHPLPKRSRITMLLNLFFPIAFPPSALNEDPVQQRDLQKSALGLHFLGADIRRPNYFWRPRPYCWAAEPSWANPRQATGGALLASKVGAGNAAKKIRLSAGKISPKVPPFWGDKRKHSTLLLLVPAAPSASPFPLVQQPHWCWRVAPRLPGVPGPSPPRPPWRPAPSQSLLHHTASGRNGSPRPEKGCM